MIELIGNRLRASFPEVHPDAICEIEFQRTLRVPDDGKQYPLPAGLGAFPLLPVTDYAVPEEWKTHGGVFMPIYQSEAMWIKFSVRSQYPFAVKVASGKINAVTGDSWDDMLHPAPQDYLALPDQPWLDGFCVTQGTVRQFVATPLGQGHTIEEQVTGKAEWGGIQLIFYPMKGSEYHQRIEVPQNALEQVREMSAQFDNSIQEIVENTMPRLIQIFDEQENQLDDIESLEPDAKCDSIKWRELRSAVIEHRLKLRNAERLSTEFAALIPRVGTDVRPRYCMKALEHGFAGGGLIRQVIVKDKWDGAVWDEQHYSRCYVHLLNSTSYQSITGKPAPATPITPKQYQRNGVPWFDIYQEDAALDGSSVLSNVESLAKSMLKKGQVLPDNKPIVISDTVTIKTNGRTPAAEECSNDKPPKAASDPNLSQTIGSKKNIHGHKESSSDPLFEQSVCDIEKAYDELGHTLGWRFLSVGKNVLRGPVNIALITLNPGGDINPPDHPTSSCEKGVSYLIERWAGSPPGQSTLQLQVQGLFRMLASTIGYSKPYEQLMADSLISHFIPFRSPRFADLPRKDESLAVGHQLWRRLLPATSPKLIVCLGRDVQTELRKLIPVATDSHLEETTTYQTGWGTYAAELDEFKGKSGSTRLLYLPHLSTWTLFTSPKCAMQMPVIIREACKDLELI